MKLIVSTLALRRYLHRVLARWKTGKPTRILVQDGVFKMPEFVSNYLDVECRPKSFSIEVERRQAKKLYKVCLILEDQPVTITFESSGWIKIESIII